MKIAVCSVSGKCLPVFKASLEAYGKGHELVLAGPGGLPNTAKNFGDAYNDLLFKIFETETECLVSNDDVVLNPDTIDLLLEDVAILKKQFRLGWVGARSNYVLPDQNIRVQMPGDRWSNLKWLSESQIKEAHVIAPIFCWVSKEAFMSAPFPPINWYTDNVSCADMSKLGYRHFVSRAYVHHVGGATTGPDFTRLTNEAVGWLKPNRPEYLKLWGLEK